MDECRSFPQRVGSPTTSLPTYEFDSPLSNVILPTSKILFEKGLKCGYKLPEEQNVTFEVM